MGKHGRRGREAWFGGVWNTLSHVRGNGSKRLLEPDTQSLAGVDFGTESSSRELAFLVSRPFGPGMYSFVVLNVMYSRGNWNATVGDRGVDGSCIGWIVNATGTAIRFWRAMAVTVNPNGERRRRTHGYRTR